MVDPANDHRAEAKDARRASRLLEVARSLFGEGDPEVIYERILEGARDLTGARYAALGVLNERRDALVRLYTAGIDEHTRRTIGDPPRGRGVLGLLISDPKPLRLTDVACDAASYGFPPGHPVMRSFLGVGVHVRGEARGNLYLTDKPGEFDESDEEVAMILADWAATTPAAASISAGDGIAPRSLDSASSTLIGMSSNPPQPIPTSAIAPPSSSETEAEQLMKAAAVRWVNLA